ncbi:hypothetical protein [Streptomyces sp. NPDC001851]|uniref:hypothetical protein n=1 Tax=Streptomyces sp. NPDC001851 TaxID=3154529 RepID=UPI003332A36F
MTETLSGRHVGIASSRLRIHAWKDRVLIGMGRPGPDESRQAWLQRLSRQLGTTYPVLDPYSPRRDSPARGCVRHPQPERSSNSTTSSGMTRAVR